MIYLAFWYGLPTLLLVLGGYYDLTWAGNLYGGIGYVLAAYWSVAAFGVVITDPRELMNEWVQDCEEEPWSLPWLAYSVLAVTTVILGWWGSAFAYCWTATLTWLFVRTLRLKLNMARKREEEDGELRGVVLPRHKLN